MTVRSPIPPAESRSFKGTCLPRLITSYRRCYLPKVASASADRTCDHGIKGRSNCLFGGNLSLRIAGMAATQRATPTKHASLRMASSILAAIRLLGPMVRGGSVWSRLPIPYWPVGSTIQRSIRLSSDAAPKAAHRSMIGHLAAARHQDCFGCLSDYMTNVGQPTHLAYSQGETDLVYLQHRAVG